MRLFISCYYNTGSVWPPYPGANQGFWASKAGFYKTLPNFSTPTMSSAAFPTTGRLHQTPTVTPTTRKASFPASALLRTDSVGLPTLYRPYQVLLRRYTVP
eukprot:GFUD01065448.1.p1 GENE.GFUD01065448.1~~GFUD01065448.1.p1  ORF type:complete len:101 (+),score=20.64 GFUD01065448.1:40-342(+)